MGNISQRKQQKITSLLLLSTLSNVAAREVSRAELKLQAILLLLLTRSSQSTTSWEGLPYKGILDGEIE